MAASHTPPKESEAKRPRRPKGEGSIYTTKDGRVRGALTLTDPRTGNEVRRFVSGRTKAEVSRRLAALKKDAATGALPTGTTLKSFLASWLDAERARVRVSTWRSRELHVRRYIVPAIGSIPLARP